MPIAVLILAVIAYVYAMFSLPQFRLPGAIVGVVVAAAVGWYLYSAESAADRAARVISLDEVVLDQISLDRTPRGATLRGRVANKAEAATLQQMTIEARIFDCPDADAELSECGIIGDSVATAFVSVPPGQLRGFSIPFVFSGMPDVEGELKWDQTVIAVRASN